jgi:enoyl-[acyl-carrier protein] reductase II
VNLQISILGIFLVPGKRNHPRVRITVSYDGTMKVIAVAASAEVARKSEGLGADAIVAEGSESGGLQGFGGASTMVLVPAVVDAVKVLVIAAGGIGSAR